MSRTLKFLSQQIGWQKAGCNAYFNLAAWKWKPFQESKLQLKLRIMHKQKEKFHRLHATTILHHATCLPDHCITTIVAVSILIQYAIQRRIIIYWRHKKVTTIYDHNQPLQLSAPVQSSCSRKIHNCNYYYYRRLATKTMKYPIDRLFSKPCFKRVSCSR